MKFFSKILLSLVLAFGLKAQTITSGTLTAATNNVLSTTGLSIAVLSLTDTSGVTNAIVVYDNDVATSTNIVRPAYISVALTPTVTIDTWTNLFGIVNSITNTVLVRSFTTNSATTNEANRVLTVYLSGNGTVSFNKATYGGPLGTTRGLVIRPVGAASYIMQSSPLPY